MLSSLNNPPAHEIVYRQIRDKILFGDLTPGQAVTIQGLVAECGVSMTPVREAIRRLTAEGALEFQGNRRVCVPRMTEARFAELTFARDMIEPKLAEMAAKKASAQDIDTLRAIDDALNAAIDLGDVKGYMRENHRFHFTLYGLAGSNILLPITETLWLRFGPLYRIISGKYGTESLIDRHDEAIHALRAGNATLCADAIRADIAQGFAIVRENFGWA
ncbi:MAG: GntR family transcriptional regulator [Paracoccaceae bacterium]|nr:GntR family transcriptional regulator [Paracoccaceae bacterium]